jgi:hypothetical protein
LERGPALIYRERRGRERVAEENRSVLTPSMTCLQGRISGGKSNGNSESPLTKKQTAVSVGLRVRMARSVSVLRLGSEVTVHGVLGGCAVATPGAHGVPRQRAVGLGGRGAVAAGRGVRGARRASRALASGGRSRGERRERKGGREEGERRRKKPGGWHRERWERWAAGRVREWRAA